MSPGVGRVKFNSEEFQRHARGEASTPASQNDVDTMTPAELLDLKTRVQEALGIDNLGSLDLEDELMTQYVTIKTLQTDVLKDDETPANQKAQVANAVAGTLEIGRAHV